jgi:energy-coupling factor transport system ATP-binding protein
MVFQNPETQLVTSCVLHDLAFAMENMGIDRQTMSKRMAETVSFFCLEDILHKDAQSISAVKSSLWALLCTYDAPQVLILDEPVSQLDPILQETFYLH